MKYSIQQSKLASTFQCMADKCPSTCCKGWSVVWTKEEILRLKENCTAELSEKIKTAFPRIDDYVPIKMDEDDLCPFLCKGLCSVQCQSGEEYLSYTCREYPRVTRLDGNMFIRICKNTCYRVMERIFQEEGCMEILSAETGETEISAIIKTIPHAHIEVADKIGKYILYYNGDIRKAISELKIKTGYDIPLQQIFRHIFGTELILPRNEEEKKRSNEMLGSYCKNALNNLIRSMFMEWRTHGISEVLSPEDNICVFLFSCDVMMKGAEGAAAFSSSHEEFICTMCDLAGMLYSDSHISSEIIAYRKTCCY